MSMNVGEFVWHCLNEWGLKRVYSYPGDGAGGLDVVSERAKDTMEYVQVRHEEVAAFTATVYAKCTGQPGLCYGSEHWCRHPLVREVLFTDGAKYVADQAGAYWLVDAIVFAQKTQPAVAAEEFQVWRLDVKPGNTGFLTCEDGKDRTVFTQPLEPSSAIENGLTSQLMPTVAAMPRQCSLTCPRAARSIFRSMGIIISQTSKATGRLTCATVAAPRA